MINKTYKWIKSEYFFAISISFLFGLFFWIIDGFIEFLYFRDNLHFLIVEGPQTYLESIILKVPPHGLFVRFSFVVASILGGLLVSLFISKRKKTEEALRESEEQFRTIFNTIIDVFYRSDLNGNLMMISPSGVKLLGYDSADEMLGKNIAEEFYYNPKEREKFQIDLEKEGEILNFQSILKRKDGTLINTETNSNFVYDETGKPIAVEGIFRDITKRKQAEEALQKTYEDLERRVEKRTEALSNSYKLLEKEVIERKRAEEKTKASLIEKEILLREVHHRVKNNFEVVSSLLDMSSMQTENRETQSLWKDARARIHSMALIHSQLYENDRFDEIDMERHTHKLIDHLSHVYSGTGKRITPVIAPSEVCLSVQQAIPCALVLNEFIANAFKHAFRDRKKGTIHVSINNSTDDIVLIRIKDDGDGISEGIDFNNPKGIGLKLARHLIEGQLNGAMRIHSDNGTEICIEFKKLR